MVDYNPELEVYVAEYLFEIAYATEDDTYLLKQVVSNLSYEYLAYIMTSDHLSPEMEIVKRVIREVRSDVVARLEIDALLLSEDSDT